LVEETNHQWQDMLSTVLMRVFDANPSRLNALDVVRTCGIVPLVHKFPLLTDSFWDGATGIDVSKMDDVTADTLYGDLHQIESTVFFGHVIVPKTDPTSLVAFGAQATPSFTSVMQLCTFTASLDHLAKAKTAGPTERLVRNLVDTLTKDVVSDGRTVQTAGGHVTSHVLLNDGEHSSSSRMLLTPAQWMGTTGFIVNISRTSKIVTSSRNAMFIPIHGHSFSTLVRLCRAQVTRAFRKACTTFAADATKQPSIFKHVVDTGIAFKSEELREQVFDVKRWIPMTTDTYLERCSVLARLIAFQAQGPVTGLLDQVRQRVDSGLEETACDPKWVAKVKASSDDLHGLLEGIFEPFLRARLPSDSTDATFVDVHLLTYPLVNCWHLSVAVAEHLARSMLASFAGMVPDLSEKLLQCSMPFVRLAARNVSGTVIAHVAGTPHHYTDKLRFVDMPPDQPQTLEGLQGMMHLVPYVTNRQHSLMSTLFSTGAFGGSVSEKDATLQCSRFHSIVHRLENGMDHQLAIGIDSLTAARTVFDKYATAEREKRKLKQAEAKEKKAITKKPVKEKKSPVVLDLDADDDGDDEMAGLDIQVKTNVAADDDDDDDEVPIQAKTNVAADDDDDDDEVPIQAKTKITSAAKPKTKPLMRHSFKTKAKPKTKPKTKPAVVEPVVEEDDSLDELHLPSPKKAKVVSEDEEEDEWCMGSDVPADDVV
jgi:hypothetical protein